MTFMAASASNVSVRYNNVRALNEVSIEVPEGSVMGVVGPNGSGKSTLLKAMLQLIPSSGSTKFFGKSLDEMRQRIGYMPQHNSVDWNFPITVEEVVLMGTYSSLGWFRRPGKTEKEAARQAMEYVAIQDLAKRQIGELSGGQRQRVFLTRMLAGTPDVLFMDEPFQGIDHLSQAAIVEVLHSFQAQGKTIIIVHHDLFTLTQLVDHVTLLSRGELIACGPVETAFTQDNLRRAYGENAIIKAAGTS